MFQFISHHFVIHIIQTLMIDHKSIHITFVHFYQPLFHVQEGEPKHKPETKPKANPKPKTKPKGKAKTTDSLRQMLLYCPTTNGISINDHYLFNTKIYASSLVLFPISSASVPTLLQAPHMYIPITCATTNARRRTINIPCSLVSPCQAVLLELPQHPKANRSHPIYFQISICTTRMHQLFKVVCMIEQKSLSGSYLLSDHWVYYYTESSLSWGYVMMLECNILSGYS